MPRHKTPAPLPGTGAQDFRQEITAIIQEASAERWVLEEARSIVEARAIKMAWEESLGLETPERFTPEELRRVCIFGALVRCAI